LIGKCLVLDKPVSYYLFGCRRAFHLKKTRKRVSWPLNPFLFNGPGNELNGKTAPSTVLNLITKVEDASFRFFTAFFVVVSTVHTGEG
jgi:hypothetical protein